MATVDGEHDEFDDYDPPLHHKKPFGAGLKRQTVTFVRASSPELSTSKSAATTQGSSIGDAYLGLVLPEEAKPEPTEAAEDVAPGVCPECKLPLRLEPVVLDEDGKRLESTRKHEASIAHQVCMAHSHPPSAIDRSRKGLAYLESYGWDPDARRGLGTGGQGIRHPVKVAPKDNTLGLGLVIPKEAWERVAKKKKKPEKLNAKQCRQMAEEDKKRSEKLRRQLFSNGDLEKYLGDGA